jgi:hypothetical protein
MGEQYGALAKEQLQQINTNISPKYFNIHSSNAKIVYHMLALYEAKITLRELQILRGMAKTSGLSYYQLLKIDVLPLLAGSFAPNNQQSLVQLSQQIANFEKNSSGHCSFISVWGDKTTTKSMLVARNLDLSVSIKEFLPYVDVVIYHPNNGDNSVANFSFIGAIPGFTWVNNRGLFSEYNSASSSISGMNNKGYITSNLNFNAMFIANNSKQFQDYLASRQPLMSSLVPIVDAQHSITLEDPLNNKIATPANQGANINFFTNLYRTEFPNSKLTVNNCTDKTNDTHSFACRRYHVINNYLSTDSAIDLHNLQTLITTPMDNGGIYQTGDSQLYPVREITVYSVVGDVSKGMYYYKTFDQQWQAIDLLSLFNN